MNLEEVELAQSFTSSRFMSKSSLQYYLLQSKTKVFT